MNLIRRINGSSGMGRRHLFFCLAAVIAITIVFFGCGKKGPPAPPDREPLPKIANLKKEIQGNLLTLSWYIPGSDGDHSGFVVHRSKNPLSNPVCKGCPILFKRVADIPVNAGGDENFKKNVATFRETLEKGFVYVYKVKRYTDTGGVSQDSDLIRFEF